MIVANEEEIAATHKNESKSQEKEYYRLMKEKVIGRTIQYEPPLKDALPAIVEWVFLEDPIEKTAKKNKEFKEGSGQKSGNVLDELGIKDTVVETCIDALKSEKRENLRILRHALADFKKILNTIRHVPCGNAEALHDALCEVLFSVIKIIVRDRTKRENDPCVLGWPHDREAYGDVDCLPKEDNKQAQENSDVSSRLIGKMFFSFRFVHEYVRTNVIDQEKAKQDFSEYLKRKTTEKELADDPYNKLDNYWWGGTEEELRACIGQIERNFLNNEYPPHVCLEILQKILHYAERLGIEKEWGELADRLFDHMKSRVSDGTMSIDLTYDYFRLEGYADSSPGNYTKKFKGYRAEFQTAAKERKEKDFIEALNDFKGENWSTDFMERVFSAYRGGEFTKRKAFFVLIDVEALLDRLSRATGEEWRSIYGVIQAYEDAVPYAADEDNLQKLADGLESMSLEDALARWRRKVIVKLLKECLTTLKDASLSLDR